MLFLSVTDLQVRFGGLVAVDGLSFDVAPHEIFCIIGPNGAGKTTVFNLISRIYRATSGRVEFRGHDLLALSPSRLAALGIARTFQNNELFDNGTVLQNILVGHHIHVRTNILQEILRTPAVSNAESAAREEAEKIIAFLRLHKYREQSVGSLPYGVRKMVELGRALATKPQLLLLDEPSSGLNIEETDVMAGWIKEIRRRLGTTILMVEHDMRLVSAVSDRVMAMNTGRMIAIGSPDEVQRHPAVVTAYLGA